MPMETRRDLVRRGAAGVLAAAAWGAAARWAGAAPAGSPRPQLAPPARLTAPPAPRAVAGLQGVTWTPWEQAGIDILQWGLSKLTGGLSDGPFAAILALFTGDTSDTQEILNALQQIQNELTAVNAALQELQKGITQIEADIYAQTLQQELQTYETNRSVIVANFTSLTTAMASLGSTDPTIQAQALADVNQLKGIDNVNAVLEAMYTIHTLLVGDPSVGYQSLIGYHIQGAQLAIDAYWSAATDATFQVAGLDAPAASFTRGEGTPSQLPAPGSVSYPSGGAFEDSFLVVSATPAAVLQPLMTKSIVPAYQAMLTTQLQGYQFLFLALARTAESPQLATYNSYLTAELQAMAAYFAYFDGTGNDAGAGYNAYMLQELRNHGRNVMQASQLTAFYPYDSSGDCPNKSWPYGAGWMSFDGANVGTSRIAYLNPSGATPQLVTLSKMSVWTGCGHAPNYVKPFVFGWNWSSSGAVTLPTASAKAAPVVAPIATAFLGGAPSVTISTPAPAPPAVAPALSTATPEATRTGTPGPSPTAGATHSPTPGRTATAGATHSPTPGASGTPTPGASRTATPGRTATAGATRTPGATGPTAHDGQSLASQAPHVQSSFRLSHGAVADSVWVAEHEAELDRQTGPRG
jgi:hypothetical protein